MPLTPGTKLGPYEIIELIGAGGMGEVYRAADTRLEREVALKVCAEAFSERFEREARVVASLNHPNVCTLFDVGPNYLVMELIEGPTLSDRIGEGPIPIEEALTLARQIAEALDAAHEKGIVHRDLKPGNIKITPDGVVKVLDFGLAKISALAAASSEKSPTLTVTMGSTQVGVILGTASYMSPEQAKGRAVDKRADIWAFGVVLHEMLTGQKLFERETLSETLAGVLKEPPDLTQVPAQVRPLLKRCLEKDPKKRLRDIGDAMALIEVSAESAAPAVSAPTTRTRWLWPAVAAVFLVATVALSAIHFRETTPAARIMQFGIPAPENASFTQGLFSVSPNGRYVVFGARGTDGIQRLWLRDLEDQAAKPLPGTERSGTPLPFWSPDSRFVVYDDAGAKLKLKKIDITGGPPQTIVDNPVSSALGGSWNKDNVILFGSVRGIMRVSAAGGSPTPVTSLDSSRNEIAHIEPTFLPDGKHFLYYRDSGAAETSGMAEGSLDLKPEQQSSRLPLVAADPVYVPTSDPDRGAVLFLRDGTLLAQAFENRREELTGEPVPLAERVGTSGNGILGRFAASPGGVLVYQTADNLDLQLTWYDRNGKILGKVGEPGRYSVLALSHDGTKAGLSRLNPQDGNQDVWVVDLAQGTSTRLTFDPSIETTPVFSPDASRVAYLSGRGGVGGLYAKATDGSGADEVLLRPASVNTLTDWSRDGRFLIFGAGNPMNTWVLPLTGDRKPFAFARTPFGETSARLSPDGRWIGYRSDESGRNEIYVKAFTPSPDAGSSAAKWMISRNGGAGMVHWRKDGRELYYLAADGNVMAVEVSTSPVFHPGVPKPLFAVPPALLRLSATPGNVAAVAPDGQRFLFAVPVEQNARDELSVILNWTEKLKR